VDFNNLLCEKREVSLIIRTVHSTFREICRMSKKTRYFESPQNPPNIMDEIEKILGEKIKWDK
jgi:uncharacterized protein involved in tolerance to divalent cations